MISKLPTYEDFERKMYYVANSDIHGEGVFSVEDLPEGTVIGRMHTKNGDNNYDFTELGEKHNHSNNPNCENMWIGNSRYMVTSKDIKSGEELVTNYRLQPDLEQPESFMESKDEYKDIEFGYGSSDGMFDY